MESRTSWFARTTLDEIYTEPCFPTWRYTPSYLPEGTAIGVADGTLLSEPEIFHLGFRRIRGRAGQEPIDHAIPAMTLRTVAISGPVPDDLSAASRELVASGAVSFQEAAAYTLTLDFRDTPDSTANLRPELPLVLRWWSRLAMDRDGRRKRPATRRRGRRGSRAMPASANPGDLPGRGVGRLPAVHEDQRLEVAAAADVAVSRDWPYRSRAYSTEDTFAGPRAKRRRP